MFGRERNPVTWHFQWHYDWPGPRTRLIEEAWQLAWESSESSNVFQQPTLAQLWVDTVAKPRGEHPVLLTADEGNRVIYFPFTIRKGSWKRGWRQEMLALGGGLVFDYQDPLVDGMSMTSDDWTQFWFSLYEETAQRGIHFVHIAHLISVGSLATDCPIQGIRCHVSTVAPAINLHQYGSRDEFFRSLSENQRSKINRKMRTISSLNPRLNIFSRNDVVGGLQMFDSMIQAYADQYGRFGKRHMFNDPLNVTFFQQMIRVGLPAGWLHVSTLEVDKRTISWHIGFQWRDRLYWYKPCFGTDPDKLSPGHLHIWHLVERGFEEGLKVFDFTVGDEPYKFLWTSYAPSIYRILWYSPNLVGKVNALGNSVVQKLSKSRPKIFQAGLEGRSEGMPD
jgi:CelD/BcsL family acetyltransferase involved in cellulose biosynthesis